MITMFEQLQQIKQQMTTSKPARTTSAHKIQGGQHNGSVTPWQRAQQAKKPETPRQRKTASASTKPVPDKKSANPRQHEKPGKNRQRKTNNKKLGKLVSYWPALFSLDNPRPMAVGIDAAIKADMNARQLSGKGLVLFSLGRYATHRKYLQSLVAGGPRYDLNGNPCGEVTPEEQKHAAERLEELKAAQAAARAGEGE